MSVVLVVNQEEEGSPYPVNLMRNVALHYSATDTVLLLDVDFALSQGANGMLSQVGVPQARANPKTAFVLPAFEYLPHDGVMATTQSGLKQQWEQGVVEAFHVARYPKGHSPTNYSQWWSAQGAPYGVQYADGYEPYILVHKNAVPKYDERFVGYGLNKVSHLWHVNHCGISFSVLPPPCFVICCQHEPSKDWKKTFGSGRDPEIRLKIEALWNKFRAELRLVAVDDDSFVATRRAVHKEVNKTPTAVFCFLHNTAVPVVDADAVAFSVCENKCVCGKPVFSPAQHNCSQTVELAAAAQTATC
eukprot:TRINITY_DN55434_c0_g1_i1.p1 TRINITY_DN55434_c0_g1~~TRINITY_DN55434_c0_g1_i1.p1  ORF type:complete len:328 (+),score=54.52 TRINITY_DN55434_c0_g1_i1:77-985(+)